VALRSARSPRQSRRRAELAGSGPARPAPGDSAGGGPRLSLSWFPLDPSLAAGLAPHERLFHSLQDLGRRSARASVLSDADRELAILRVAWRVGADGEWRRHADVAAAVGCSPAAIRGTKKSTPATPPTTREEVLLRTVDELHIDRFVSDTTWSEAARFYNDTELIELCALVGIRRLLHVVARAARPGPTLTGTDES
jgi:4-carboxymuconolactone decarboxylase